MGRNVSELLQKLRFLTCELNHPRLNSKILHSLLNILCDAYWIWDVESGFDYLSDGWQRILGYEANELPHHVDTWKNLMHPDDAQRVYDAVASHFESLGKIPYECDFRMRNKNGLYLSVIASGAVIDWRDGKPLIMAGTITSLEK